MKIINIVPGFGGSFYCGNCLRDGAFVKELRREGHQATILPMYLPLTMGDQVDTADQDTDTAGTPVFYGAVSIYLKQQFPIMRKMPHWMEKIFNSKPMLKVAASKAGSTRAQGMEALTESMLLGKDGFQREELNELTGFLKNHEKPDIVHISNVLLLGLAQQIREEVKVPVVFSLQDEDVWIDAMDPRWQQRMWDLMARKARDVDAFVSVSRWFAGKMQEKLSIPGDKLHVIPIGIVPDAYSYHEPAVSPPAIGYLSRLNEENGFGLLVDAFLILKKNGKFPGLRLHATGGYTGDDKTFINKQVNKIKQANVLPDFTIFEDYRPGEISSFFRTLSVMSVPVLKGEAFGLYQIEALASGVPLVQPALGAFPEIMKVTGGGITYQPNTPEALAEALAGMLADPARLAAMAVNGRKVVEEKFDATKVTQQMISLYQSLISSNLL